jgi:hypothetical protein
MIQFYVFKITELKELIREAEEISFSSMKRLIGKEEKLTVFNSLSWDREDYVFLNTYIQITWY